MTWNKTDLLLKRRLNQHGLALQVEAGVLCRKAEQLYPQLFQAISIRNSSLHLQLKQDDLLSFKLIQGKLLEELNQYANQQHLPSITHIRLTFSND